MKHYKLVRFLSKPMHEHKASHTNVKPSY